LIKLTKTVSQLIADELYNFGVTDIFCVVGGAIAPLCDVFSRDPRFRLHYLLHEQSAGIAAEAYSSIEGKPSLLLVTSGPGATNAMTPLVAAWTNSTPIIVIAGQVRSIDVQTAGENRQWGSQHIDSISMVSKFTKGSRIIDPDTVHAVFPKYLALSTAGRPGPIWFEIPVDVQRSVARTLHFSNTINLNGDSYDLETFNDHFLKSLEKSKRPLVLLGNGCRTALPKVMDFVRNLGVPIQVTWPALDFIDCDDPLYGGRPGSISTWSANITLQSADLVLILGARLDWGQVAFKPSNFAANSQIFRVEIDIEEVRRIPSDRCWDAIASVDEFLTSLNMERILKASNRRDVSIWSAQVKTWQKELSSFGSEAEIEGISMYDMLDVISRKSDLFPVLVSGSSGTCTEQVMQAYRPRKSQRVVNSGGLGSMGFGVAGAIGAYYATGKAVLCLESDGSFSLNPQDIAHIVNNNLPIRILIMDSKGYKSILLSQIRGNYTLAGVNQETGLDILTSDEIAKSMGMPSYQLLDTHLLERVIGEFLNETSPALLRVVLSESEEAAPRVISKPNEHGKMETSNLEDLWPPLPTEKYENFVKPWISHNL
jgi:acetolactate synthase I/II/III large subunit